MINPGIAVKRIVAANINICRSSRICSLGILFCVKDALLEKEVKMLNNFLVFEIVALQLNFFTKFWLVEV